MLELKIGEKSRILSKQLKNMKLPSGCLIAAVIRGQEAFVPNGESLLEANDRVILLTLPGAINTVEAAFS